MEMYIINIVSTFISLASLIFTTLALLVCFTQQSWKKRDAVLLFSIFFIDVIFSCVVATTNITLLRSQTGNDIKGGVILANALVFVFLLSWASQCLIAVNRYVVIIFPFAYKKILSKKYLCSLVASMWLLCAIGCILSITFGSVAPVDGVPLKKLAYQFILIHLSKNVIITILSLHLLFLVVIFLMECYLWKIARGHQTRYRSITHSVSTKEDTSTNAVPETKRQSISQTLQKRLSFSTQKMAVRRTPFMLLGAHFSTILPYCTLAVIYVTEQRAIFVSNAYSYVCMFLLIANSLRPIINVFHHISSNKMKRFKLLLQMLISKQSSELCTEYYIENHKEVENMFKMRRESAHSLVTDGSVV